MKFTPIFFAMLPALTVFATQAEVYQVVELGPVDGYKSSFSAAINNSNQSVGTLTGQFNYPVDLTYIDFTSTGITSYLTAAEIEEVKKGNVNAKALQVLLNYLQTLKADYKVQRFTDAFASRLDNRQLVKLRETAQVQTNYEYLTGINDLGQMIGYASAPFAVQSFTPAATTATPNPVAQRLWVPKPGYLLGTVINNGNAQTLPPLYTLYGGGYSVARGLNNNGKVIGFGSVGMPDTVITAITASCDGKAQPVDLCYYSITSSAQTQAYTVNGLVWQLDAAGKPGAPVQLGYLGDKNTGKAHTNTSYPAVQYVGTPNDVNDTGLIVGSSVYTDGSDIRYSPFSFRDEVYTVTQATIFTGTEVLPILNPLEWEYSNATAVNNKNIVVGAAQQKWYTYTQSRTAQRFFIYDYNTQKLSFPQDLFSTANTVPEAINDNNLVVGTTEAFTDQSSSRRSVAFLYDMNTDKFTNLNTMLKCNAGYTLVSAMDINEKNVILATAVKVVDRKDVKGDVIKDSAGNTVKEEVAVSVQLNPVAGGSIDNCAPSEDADYQRKGGSLGAVSLSLLLLTGLLRRRRKI
jgi:hypothetical protein